MPGRADPAIERSVEITPLPPPSAGRVLWRDKVFGCVVVTLLIVLLLFTPAVLILLMLGETLTNSPQFERMWLPACVIGVLGLCVGLLGVGLYPWADWAHLLHVARQEIARHADKVVDPSHPQALFVRIVPRERWRRQMLQP